MKTIEKMTLEELKEEKERLIKEYKMLLGTSYAVPRILSINKQIEKLLKKEPIK